MSATVDRRVHVLQVVHDLAIGGTQRVVRDLALHFNDARFRTSVCCLDELGAFGEELQRRGVAVTVLGRKSGVDLSLTLKLCRIISRERVNLVHAHQYTSYFYAAPACLMAPRTRVVFTEHGRPEADQVRLKRALANQILRLVTAEYTAVSEFSRRSLVAFEKMPVSRVRVIHNGVAVEPIASTEDRLRTRVALGLGATTPVALTVGRLDRVKDFGTLLRAFSLVVRDLPDATLLIAGDGDRAYRAELLQQVTDLALEGHARFLGSRRDVPALLAACDVFALTSITEALPLSVLEAMQAGRPVVATRVGGTAEAVVDGRTGILLAPGDAPAAAAALRRLLSDPEEAGRLGRAGQARTATAFSWARALADYRTVYDACLAR